MNGLEGIIQSSKPHGLEPIVEALESAGARTDAAVRAAQVLLCVQWKNAEKETEGERVGCTVVVGYDPKNRRHKTRVMELDHNIYSLDGHSAAEPVSIYQPNIVDYLHQPQIKRGRQLKSILQMDGAVLVAPEGDIYATGYNLNVNPEAVLTRMKIPNHRKPYQRFGFAHRCGTRHVNAIAASYDMPGTVIYVLSQEKNSIRVFYGGKIIYSALNEPVKVKNQPEAQKRAYAAPKPDALLLQMAANM